MGVEEGLGVEYSIGIFFFFLKLKGLLSRGVCVLDFMISVDVARS